MIRTLSIALMTSLVLLGASLTAVRLAGAQEGKPEEALTKLEERWATAYVQKDYTFLEQVTADDYTFTDPSGMVLDRKGEIDELKSGAVTFTGLTPSDMKVRVYGQTGIVMGKITLKGKAGNEDISGDYRFTDVFVRSGGQWRCVAGQATRVMGQ